MKTRRESAGGVHHKKPRSAGLSVLIYDRILHPELFVADARKTKSLGEFDINLWLLAGGGHMAAICGPQMISEVACFPNTNLPERGLVERLPCKGDKLFDLPLGEDYHYYLALNEEHISSEALFENSVQELLRLAEEQAAVLSHRRNELGQTEYLSVLVAQLHRRAIHMEGFHLLGEARVVIRTQSVLEPKLR